MSNILTLEHLKGLRDLLMTKSDDDLARMHSYLLRCVGGISHKIQAGDVNRSAHIVSGTFPDVRIGREITGGISDETLSKIWKVLKIILAVVVIFYIAVNIVGIGTTIYAANKLAKDPGAIDAALVELLSTDFADSLNDPSIIKHQRDGNRMYYDAKFREAKNAQQSRAENWRETQAHAHGTAKLQQTLDRHGVKAPIADYNPAYYK
jgi:hypothetical protein